MNSPTTKAIYEWSYYSIDTTSAISHSFDINNILLHRYINDMLCHWYISDRLLHWHHINDILPNRYDINDILLHRNGTNDISPSMDTATQVRLNFSSSDSFMRCARIPDIIESILACGLTWWKLFSNQLLLIIKHCCVFCVSYLDLLIWVDSWKNDCEPSRKNKRAITLWNVNNNSRRVKYVCYPESQLLLEAINCSSWLNICFFYML